MQFNLSVILAFLLCFLVVTKCDVIIILWLYKLFFNWCRVYTCRFDNQVPNAKLVKKYFLVVKLAQYFVCEEDIKLSKKFEF